MREALTGELFNLIKKPDEQQRQVIVDGCVALAEGIGADRTASELLPQIWEQVGHKTVERRILVAEACAKLVRHPRGGPLADPSRTRPARCGLRLRPRTPAPKPLRPSPPRFSSLRRPRLSARRSASPSSCPSSPSSWRTRR